MQVINMYSAVREMFPGAVVRDHGIDLHVTARAVDVSGTASPADARGVGQVRICRSGDVRITDGHKWWMAVCNSPADTYVVLHLVAQGLPVTTGRRGTISPAGHYCIAH